MLPNATTTPLSPAPFFLPCQSKIKVLLPKEERQTKAGELLLKLQETLNLKEHEESVYDMKYLQIVFSQNIKMIK